jgi:hypothetical protein
MNSLDRALGYIRRGFAPIPIPSGKKGPRTRSWQNLRITEATAPNYFSGTCNIGVILGQPSSGLIDIDLDCPEAIDLAPTILPITEAIFGRASKPRSHRLYRVHGAAQTEKFCDPINGGTLLELRGDGGFQTVFPGSIHPSGEPIEWEEEGEPAPVDAGELAKKAGYLAAGCLVKRYCNGVTDEASMIAALETVDVRLAKQVRERLELAVSSSILAVSSSITESEEQTANCAGNGQISSPLNRLPPQHILLRKREHLADRIRSDFAHNDLGDCVRELTNQGEPGRANLLYKQAIRMGAIITRKEIDQTKVTNALFAACVLNGLVGKNGERDVIRQIERGYRFAAEQEQSGALTRPILPHSGRNALLITATPFVAINLAKIPPRQWLYGRHYVRKYVTANVGPGGSAKTASKLAEAVSMAVGRDLLNGDKRIDRLRVWYWNGEDPLDEIKRRIAAICLYYKVDAQQLEGWLFIDSGHDMPLCLATENRSGIAFNEDVINAVHESLEQNKIDVMIIDPFISIHRVSENNNPVIDQVVKLLGRIANQNNCAIEIVHHVRKPAPGQHEITADDTRGGGAIVNAVRSCQVLNRMSKTEAQQARIPEEERFRYFRVDSGKQNLAPPEKAKWRYLHSIDLPNGDNVQVVEFWQFPEPFNAVTQEEMEFIRTTAREGIHNRWDTRAKSWIGRPLADRLGLDAQNKADREDIRAKLNICRKSGMIAVETRLDAKRRRREFVVAGPSAGKGRGPAPDVGQRQGQEKAQE